MKFDMNNLNPGTWFYFDDEKPEEGRVCLRVCNGEILDQIDRETVSRKVEYRKHQRYETEDVDDKKRDLLMWDYVIVDWENLCDANGKEIPCTAENKAKLMTGSPFFFQFVSDCVDRLNAEQAAIREQEEKN